MIDAAPNIPKSLLDRFRASPEAISLVRQFWYCKGIQSWHRGLAGMTEAVNKLQQLGFFVGDSAGSPMPTTAQVEGGRWKQ